MSYSVKVLERQFSIHVYDGDGPNYMSSCLINRQGDTGFFSLVNGRGFYLAAEHILAACEERGLTILSGYVTPAHVRLLRKTVKKFANLTSVRTGHVAGHEMTLVEITRK